MNTFNSSLARVEDLGSYANPVWYVKTENDAYKALITAEVTA